MKRKDSNKIVIVLIAILMVGNKVYASETSENNKGIIIIENENGNQDLEEKFLCDKIANIKNGNYIMEPEYADKNLDLKNISTAEELQQTIENINPCKKSKTIIQYADQEGNVKFDNLETGIYFIRKEEINKKQMIPILVSVPMWSETKKAMEYEVKVIPKYVEKPINDAKQLAETGDNKQSLMKMFGICLISCFIITLCRHYRKILQKY